MERILLVEPNYKNKYPPIGLMKLATFYKERGDIVEFYKGEAPYTKIINSDRIYITSMFTFHYDITVKTIKHYLKYQSKDAIYIGGIAVSLLASQFAKETGISNILAGLLTDASVLGYSDHTNIDRLPLDYDILDDSTFIYPAADNYFIHATRGCPRGCEFCAVRLLEPEFMTTNSVIKQVQQVNDVYGEKRNLLMMDNNILCSSHLDEIISDIVSVGFSKSASYLRPNAFVSLVKKIERRKRYHQETARQAEQLLSLLFDMKKRIARYESASLEYEKITSIVTKSDDKLLSIYENYDYYEMVFNKYASKSRISRYVDFNQGIDARLINEKTMSILSKIPIRPFRLAFDDVKDKGIFWDASVLAHHYGVSHFSNYLLYNWQDEPKHLWERLSTAIDFYNIDNSITGFSFPMKYAPIDQTNRDFVGQHWKKKYLRAINVIINVTNGVVAKERDFFEKAFGRNLNEYFEILAMPDEFIRYRKAFEELGFIKLWQVEYHKLSEDEKKELVDIVGEAFDTPQILQGTYSSQIRRVLLFYLVRKHQLDKLEITIDMLKQKLDGII